MAIKAVLDNLDGVPEHLKAEYKPSEGGKFFLVIDGLESHEGTGALKRAKDREHEDRVKAETERNELKKRLDAISEENEARLRGMLPKENVAALDKSWGEKFAAKEQEWGAERSGYVGNIQRLLVDNEAQKLAAAVAADSKHVPLLIPHIMKRLSVEMTNGIAATRVLDKDGKPSASTLDDLRKELLTDPMFSAVVVGTKATGSGAGGASSGSASGGGHGGSAPVRDPKKPLAGMDSRDLGALMRAKREAAAAGK